MTTSVLLTLALEVIIVLCRQKRNAHVPAKPFFHAFEHAMGMGSAYMVFAHALSVILVKIVRKNVAVMKVAKLQKIQHHFFRRQGVATRWCQRIEKLLQEFISMSQVALIQPTAVK